MPFRSALVVLFLFASIGRGADVRTLAGKTVSGDLVSLSEKEVVIRSGGENVTTAIEQVLTIDFKEDKLVKAGTPYTAVELTDGTLLHCGHVALKGKQVEMTLLGGQQVKVPLAAVKWLLTEAHDAKIADVFQGLVKKARNRDTVVAKTGGQLSGLDGTLGDADDKGQTIEFEPADVGQKVKLALAKVQGLIFLNKLGGEAPIPICKLSDNHKNTVIVSGLTSGPAGLTVTTPSGAKIEYTQQLVARLDFSKGKLTFLSDLHPARVVETNNLDRVEHYRRDQNLEGEKITLDNKKYDKGLALHAYTELEYKLDGDYEFFSAVIGVDDTVGGTDGPTVVRLLDGEREIKSWTVTRKDKPVPVRVPIRDVRRFRIVVSSGELLDLGKHVCLADAKVSK